MGFNTKVITLLCFLLLIYSFTSFKLISDLETDRNKQLGLDYPEGPALPYNQTKAKQYAYISMITHCSDSQITQWNCKLCRNVFLTEVSLIQNQTYNIAGFIGYSRAHNQIVISWRGTVDIKNWQVDFKYRLTKYSSKNANCTNCQIHTGIYQAYKSVQNQINSLVNKLLSKYPTATIISVGHSLGGGLSLLTSLQMSIAFPQKVSYTYNYGCLKIGNGNFVNFLKSKVSSIYRVVHNKDPVPHLPPYDFGYIHPANQIFYDQPMTSHVICNDSGEDKGCSNKYVPYLQPNDHTFYFVATDASVC